VIFQLEEIKIQGYNSRTAGRPGYKTVRCCKGRARVRVDGMRFFLVYAGFCTTFTSVLVAAGMRERGTGCPPLLAR
jgi:uncharacterized membrane protein